MPRPKFSPMAGTMVAANFEFLDEADAPADPDAVAMFTRSPIGTIAAQYVSRLGVGLYRSEFLVNVGGVWVVRVEGSGSLVVAEEAQFEVRSAVVVVAP